MKALLAMKLLPRPAACLLLACFALWGAGRAAQGEDAKEPVSLREMMDAAVNQFAVFADADAKQPAVAQVALRWANNARGSEDGMTLLYIHQGRPLAAACLFPWAGRLVHDFEALSEDKIVARRGDRIVWQPRESGVKFADIPDAPLPEATPAQRLRQMKSLAEQFQSTMLGWKADSTDREELRLLSRPLYRYEPAEGPIFDGAVFAFAMGTDPESLLLIEAVKEGDKGKWRFAFARRTSGELEGRHRDKVVWKAARFPTNNDPTKPHFSIGVPIPADLLHKTETP
jgi:hypothetical protein